MSGIRWLDWAALAISLHNMILLLWLGMTVLLNAERRTRGIWLIGGSLLLAGAFFAGHSIILFLGLYPLDAGLDFWWHLTWFPAIILPQGWYLVTLWYAGFWQTRGGAVRNRHAPWLAATSALTLGIAVYLAVANPLPSLAHAGPLQLDMPAIGGVPILLVVYVTDILLCIALALDAVRGPAPSTRLMGDLARGRARPWFVSTSLCLMAVALLVAAALFWLVLDGARAMPPDPATTTAIALFDLAIAALVGAATILVGQAVARYQVFTGKALPRRGFMRLWYNAVVLAAGYGMVVSASLVLRAEMISTVLLTATIMTVFYALFNWRSFAERDRYIRDLRPFVTSQHLYDHLLENGGSPAEIDAATPFAALCRDVLGARTAQLTPVGPLAPLVPALVFPNGARAAAAAHFDVTRFDLQTLCVALEPAQHDGLVWAVPLWSERGLIGVLSLGDKSDGELYSQEEIEIARASGERLIDTCASAALARRLMTLQRQRLTETQVLDRRARRMLHDEILPRLHAAMLMWNTGPAGAEAVDALAQVHRQISDLLHDLPAGTAPEIAQLGLVAALQRVVDKEWRRDFDAVTWEVDAKAENRGRAVPPFAAEALYFAAREAVRNAARHGRAGETGRPLHLSIRVRCADGLTIEIEDDGIGIRAEKRPAVGAGQGLALHSAMLAIVGGTLVVGPNATDGTRVVLNLPQSVAAT